MIGRLVFGTAIVALLLLAALQHAPLACERRVTRTPGDHAARFVPMPDPGLPVAPDVDAAVGPAASPKLTR